MINIFPLTYVSFLFFIYGLRPDFFSAITIVPAWIWPIPGFYFLRIFWEYSKSSKKSYILLISLVLWVLFIAINIEELRSIPKNIFIKPISSEKWLSLNSEGKAIRVVTYNSDSKIGIFQELERFSPDILLLQEAPDAENIDEPIKKVFGSNAGVCFEGGNYIISRGKVFPEILPSPIKNFAVQAKVVLDSGFECNVVCFRLKTPEVRFDYWSPDCWRKQRENRIFQRTQINRLIENLDKKITNYPLIFGGDFNAPQGDAIFNEISPFLRDSFFEKGVGWGNTINSKFAVLRIDQIWINDYFDPLIVQVQKSIFSDHNFVVCDLLIKKEKNIENKKP
jgi:hypothetical protein